MSNDTQLPVDRMQLLVREQLGNALSVLKRTMEDEAIAATICAAATATAKALLSGHKLLIAGNGGSAADAQHLAAEFAGRLTVDRPALRAIALTTDSSILTAVANDYGFEEVFARQVEALGQAGDVFLGISTSGNSPNVLRALELSKERKMITVGFTGRGGGSLAALCDFCAIVPSAITQHIQECHLALEHIFCMLVERCYFGVEFFDRAR